jgi:hypothetical protein
MLDFVTQGNHFLRILDSKIDQEIESFQDWR